MAITGKWRAIAHNAIIFQWRSAEGKIMPPPIDSPRFEPLFQPLLRAAGGFYNPAAVTPASYAPYPAPSGFRWDFVRADGVQVTAGTPIVSLIRI